MRAHMSTTRSRVGRRGRVRIGPRSAGALGLTALTCAGLAAAAFAGLVKYDTRLTGHRERGFYHGYVTSEVHKCEPGRRVVLFKLRPGADRKIGTDRSDREGGWNVDPPQRSARFYAKVNRKSGNGWVCRADRVPSHGALPPGGVF